MEEKTYLCIDLKSFYASVECVERGLDPMTTNLVVADPERGRGTVCLAVSPSMKALGIRNRCRVYEIPEKVEYIMAPPRMNLYIAYAADVYAVYLKYLAKEDIHVYSVDEAFLDITHYGSLYRMGAGELAERIMAEIKEETGITATAGIGTNLDLAKVALDIMAKHAVDHIGFLDEEQYRKTLWDHRPLTDFWRVGAGTAKRLGRAGIRTMREIARTDEEVLYGMFGVDAELLVDHAWGRESATMEDIRNYTPKSRSVSCGQVLLRDYTYQEAGLLLREMADSLCLDLTDQGLVTKSLTITVGYSYETGIKPSSGTVPLPAATDSYRVISAQAVRLYERISRRDLPIRRLHMTCNGVADEAYEQYDLFTEPQEREREQRMQRTVLEIKKRFGKNALLRGMDLMEEANARERNRLTGGHRSGV